MPETPAWDERATSAPCSISATRRRAAAYGAALLGGVAAGIWMDVPEASRQACA
jgi:hypothetical protein